MTAKPKYRRNKTLLAMLWLIGIGVNGYKGVSLYTLEILKKCDIIYFERFTSPLYEDDLFNLNSLIGGGEEEYNNKRKMVPAERWFVEDGNQILEQAKNGNVALITYGDPLIATTLSELEVRARKNLINVDVVHSASGITSLIGESGLHMYKFGRAVTMMSGSNSAISDYNAVFDNLLSGSHTLILTEYNNNDNKFFFLDPVQVFKMLIDIEKDLKYNVLSEETFVIVASRIGTEQKKIISGKIKSLTRMSFETGPHSIIITGSLHFTESDAVRTLTINVDEPTDNSENIQKISVNMIKKYTPKAKQAIKQMKDIIIQENSPSLNKGSIEVLDNAEYYVDDAERFLRQGKHELAVLSIGYAEGLIDALRFQKGINPWP
jgi:diphthine synthase